MDTQIEEGCVESANIYLIDEEEDLLKLKNKILDFFEAEDVFDPDFDLDEYIRESLEKYQRHTMALKKILMKQEEEIKRLKTQVNEKEESCHKLEVEVVDLRRKEEK
jgi:predicted RNase H-like nuclease (RuvC/YqgF family)